MWWTNAPVEPNIPLTLHRSQIPLELVSLVSPVEVVGRISSPVRYKRNLLHDIEFGIDRSLDSSDLFVIFQIDVIIVVSRLFANPLRRVRLCRA